MGRVPPRNGACPRRRSPSACGLATPRRHAVDAHDHASRRVDHHAGVAASDADIGGPQTLAGVETVIVDEVHAIAGTKRRAHLALSLERLDDLLQAPAQRIGLVGDRASARGGRPALGRERAPTTIVTPPAAEDLRADRAGAGTRIWPTWRTRPLADVEARPGPTSSKPTLTIVLRQDRRRLAERLTARLNEIDAERWGVDGPATMQSAKRDEEEPGNRALSSETTPQVAGGAPAHLLAAARPTAPQPYWPVPPRFGRARSSAQLSKRTSKPDD